MICNTCMIIFFFWNNAFQSKDYIYYIFTLVLVAVWAHLCMVIWYIRKIIIYTNIMHYSFINNKLNLQIRKRGHALFLCKMTTWDANSCNRKDVIWMLHLATSVHIWKKRIGCILSTSSHGDLLIKMLPNISTLN